jgi:hypothetical protein
MFVWTALDESADRLQKHAYTVAALLTTQENWFKIERAWNKRLAKEGLAYFKTSEYRGLKGQFSKFRDPKLYPPPAGRKAAQEILFDLELILKSEDLIGLCVALNLSDYRRIRKSARARKLLPANPYRLAYETAMVAIATRVSQSDYPRVIAFLFDEHSKATQLVNGYSSLKAANPNAATCMGSLTIAKDSEWAAIQAADLVAGICKDYFVKSFAGLIVDEKAAAQQLKAEVGNHVSPFYIDEVALTKIIRGNLLHNGRPSIRSTKQATLFDDLFRGRD